MSNEIATQNTQTPAPVERKTLMQKGVEKLRQHAELKAMAMDYAEFITKAGSCPDTYRGKPLDAAAVIIRGTALGFDPDGALEAFFVVKGKTGMYARAMRAVAEFSGCEIWEVEATDEKVTLAGRKPGSDKVQAVTWDMARATKAGYTTNNRYKTNPQEMLRAKCEAELARLLAPGALMGLYSEYEQAAFEPKTVQATATRVDQGERGADAVRAALAAKKKQEPVVEDVLSKLLASVQQADSVDQLKEIMNPGGERTKLNPDEDQQLRDTASAKLAELEAEGAQ